MDKTSYWYEPSYSNEKMSNAISRTYILPRLGSVKYFCYIPEHIVISHSQGFGVYI